jgi:carboxymethylenebutenolidase
LTAVETIELARQDDRSFVAEYVRASEPRACGILLLTAIWGIDDPVRAVIAELIGRGHDVLIPDLFWRTIPGSLDRSRGKEALERMADFDVAAGIADTDLAARTLRERLGPGRAIAAIGFCFGGRYAFTAALDEVVDAAIVFHGTGLANHLDTVGNVTRPIQLHFGGRDDFVSATEVERIREATAAANAVEVIVYPLAEHGFSLTGHPHHHAESSALAWHRAFGLLQHLSAP